MIGEQNWWRNDQKRDDRDDRATTTTTTIATTTKTTTMIKTESIDYSLTVRKSRNFLNFLANFYEDPTEIEWSTAFPVQEWAAGKKGVSQNWLQIYQIYNNISQKLKITVRQHQNRDEKIYIIFFGTSKGSNQEVLPPVWETIELLWEKRGEFFLFKIYNMIYQNDEKNIKNLTIASWD